MLHLPKMLDHHLQMTQVLNLNGKMQISNIVGGGMGGNIDDIGIIRADRRTDISKNTPLVLR